METQILRNEHDTMESTYAAECREQPARLAELCNEYDQSEFVREQLPAFRRAVLNDRPIIWAGMGASYCASLPGSLLLQSCGRPSFIVEASEWLYCSTEIWSEVAGPILVTASGESAELVELCQQRGREPRILLCNDVQSSCWSAAHIRFPILAGPEQANATKSYTNSTAASIILASEVTGREWQRDVAVVIRGFESGLDRVLDIRQQLECFTRDAVDIEVVGRGPSFSGAMMGALCLREMTGIRVAPHSGGAFRHGPLLDVDESHLAIVLAIGREAELGVRLAHDCVSRGGKVILVETVNRVPSKNLFPVKIEPVPEPWEAITSVLVPQVLTLAMIERLGTKYTRTCTTVQ